MRRHIEIRTWNVHNIYEAGKKENVIQKMRRLKVQIQEASYTTQVTKTKTSKRE